MRTSSFAAGFSDVTRGFVYGSGKFVADSSWAPALSDAQLGALVGTLTDALTFTCVPPGSGARIGIDRDGDGYADGDELAFGSDPADPTSVPSASPSGHARRGGEGARTARVRAFFRVRRGLR